MTEVEPAVRAEATIKDIARSNWDAVSGVLPKTLDQGRFARMIFNSVRKTPRLAQATASSLFGAMLAAASLGLEVDTPMQEAFLVPYKRNNKDGRTWIEAQFIMGYQGYVKLFLQHPDASRVSSDWVGENDEFSFSYGTHPRLEHVPSLGQRGKPVAFWAAYQLKDGTTDFKVLSPAAVRSLRGDSKSDIADPEHWMSRKTALRQLLKLAPKSVHLATAMAIDEQDTHTIAQVPGMEAVAQIAAEVDAEPGEETP